MLLRHWPLNIVNINLLGLEVIDTEKESAGKNGDLLSETLNGDGGNVELVLAESIVA